MIKDILQEATLRIIFNTLLLTVVILPLFSIPAAGLPTLAIVILLEIANQGFTWVWRIGHE